MERFGISKLDSKELKYCENEFIFLIEIFDRGSFKKVIVFFFYNLVCFCSIMKLLKGLSLF